MSMSRFFIVTFNFLLSAVCSNAASSAAEADSLARASKYVEAIDAYEAVIADGYESAGVYYNLGFCYYCNGQLGKAVLNMERSRRLDPSNDDVDANLKFLATRTDQLQVVEPVFFQQWWTNLKNAFNSDGWAVVFIILFALSLSGVGCFLFAESVHLRKVGFFSAILLFAVAFFTLSFSLQKRSSLLDGDEAVVMSSSVNMNTSPDKNGSLYAVIHEGTRVTILDSLGEWIEIKLADGNVGWIKLSEVEKI